MPEYSVIGRRLPRVDALEHATGAAIYSADVVLPNMLQENVPNIAVLPNNDQGLSQDVNPEWTTQ